MSHFHNTSNFILNVRKNNTQALLLFRKDSSSPRMTEQMQIL